LAIPGKIEYSLIYVTFRERLCKKSILFSTGFGFFNPPGTKPPGGFGVLLFLFPFSLAARMIL